MGPKSVNEKLFFLNEMLPSDVTPPSLFVFFEVNAFQYLKYYKCIYETTNSRTCKNIPRRSVIKIRLVKHF